MNTALLLALVFAPMILEARLAAGNERAQRARGGIEPAGDVYRIMRIAYPAAFAVMIAEGAWSSHAGLWVPGVMLFVAAKALKWWAVATLGSCWTFRVIVVPGAALVSRGPYRFLRHPNYVAVAGELVSVGLMAGALFSGPLMTLMFSALMLKRISIEDGALEPGRHAS